MTEQVTWLSPQACKHHGNVLWKKDDQSVIACEVCGYSHLVPLPDTDQLRKFYEEQFYQQERPDYLAASQVDADWLETGFTARLEKAERFFPKVSQPRVLDIGCGPGSFLEAAVKRGWQTVGVEPSAMAVEYGLSRGLDIRKGFFSDEMLPQLGMFDMVHMSEVLEHIPDPDVVLATAIKCLKPGGVLSVSVPNDFNAFQKALVKSEEFDPWWVVPDHHLNYFSFDSLELLIERCGLSLRSRSTNFPMEIFLLMGKNYTNNRALGKEMHTLRKSFDMTLHENGDAGVLESFYEAMATAGCGRLAIVYAQNPIG